jgi:hypothetical protein
LVPLSSLPITSACAAAGAGALAVLIAFCTSCGLTDTFEDFAAGAILSHHR